MTKHGKGVTPWARILADVSHININTIYQLAKEMKEKGCA